MTTEWRDYGPEDTGLPTDTPVRINGKESRTVGDFDSLSLPGGYPFLAGMAGLMHVEVSPGPEQYQAARDRMEQAGVRAKAARSAMDEAEGRLDDADTEWHAAQMNLERFEITPGVPKPEYREKTQ